MQKGDFLGIFREMKGLPVTIRLLDPPLHEFLPQEEKDIEALAKTMGVSIQALKNKVEFLHEFNPMLGHRGCRLGLTYPEIYDMQVQAIMEAACELVKNEGYTIVPEIMIPLVAVVEELKRLRENAVRICEEVIARYGVKVDYLIGTMIELPRAALTADEIAAGGGFLLLRHQRPDPDHLRPFPRRRRQVPPLLRRERTPAGRPVRHPRPERRRPAGEDGVREGARPRVPISSSASAASMAAIPHRSSSATRSGSIMSPARRSGCPLPDWRLPMRRWRTGSMKKRGSRLPAPPLDSR